jgi:hypothetical protein
MEQQKAFSYLRQRSFYDDFSFYPAQKLKSYGNSIYKTYYRVYPNTLPVLDYLDDRQV